jgi:hypothetical protein
VPLPILEHSRAFCCLHLGATFTVFSTYRGTDASPARYSRQSFPHSPLALILIVGERPPIICKVREKSTASDAGAGYAVRSMTVAASELVQTRPTLDHRDSKHQDQDSPGSRFDSRTLETVSKMRPERRAKYYQHE